MTGNRHVLALETSTEACSVALESGGRIYFRHEIAPRQHAELVLPWVEALCVEAGIQRAQISHLAVGVGPGAFTGVRLGVALAQGLAFAHNLPVAPISTLRIVAAGATAEEGQRICVAMDARMQEIYCGKFEWQDGVPLPLGEADVRTPESLLPDGTGWLGYGTGFAAYADRFSALDDARIKIIDPHAVPDARALLRLVDASAAEGWVHADDVEPVYLRNNVAQTIAERELAKRNAS